MSTSKNKDRWRSVASYGLRAALAAGVVAGLAYALQGMDIGALWHLLRHASGWALALGICGNFVNLFGKASSWWFFLGRAHRPALPRLWRLSLYASAANLVMPLRAGDGLRVWWLHKEEGTPVATLTGVALAEKLLNALLLACLIVPLPWLVPQAPSWLVKAIPWTVGLLLLAVLALCLLQRFVPKRRWPWLTQALALWQVGPWNLLGGAMAILLGWFGDMTLVWAVLRTCGIEQSPSVAPLILFAINVALVVPSTPGHVGTLELAALGVLGALGVAREPAMAFAVFYHALQVLPVLLLAGTVWLMQAAWRRLSPGARAKKHPAASAQR